MAQVPTYGAPQEQLRPLNPPDVKPSQQGKQIQQFGAAVQDTGAGVSAVAYKMQERENADSIFRAETALKDDLIKYEQDTRQNRQGRFAKDLVQDSEKWFEERMRHHVEGLGNDAQRGVFSQRATRIRQQAIASFGQWEQAQLERSHDEGWAANKGVTVSGVAASPTPEAVTAGRLELEKLNRYQAARKGWTPERLAQEQLRDTTAMHKEVIQTLVRTDPIAAKDYFEANKKEIDGTQHAEIGAFADKVTATAIGERAAATVWGTIGPKGDTDAVELDKMAAQIRKELKGNEPAIDEALKGLRERAVMHKDSRRERGEAMESGVNQRILNGESWAAIRRSPEFLALPPEQARRIAEHMERQAAARASRAAAESSRADAEESRAERRLNRQGMDTALRLSDPNALAAMTRDQVVNLLPELGAQHTAALVQKWDAYKKTPEKMVEASIDKQDFDAAVLEAGLNPTPKTNDVDEKHALIRLQSHVETVIDQEQRARGGKLSREDKAKIVRRELDKKVMVEGWFGSRKEVPAPMISPEQLRKAVVDFEGREFKLSSIPESDLNNIVAAARRAGVNATPALIASKYAELQQKRRSQGQR